jgi:predicted RNA-binding Zn ribbon-like protein
MNLIWPAKKFQLVGGELCLDFCNTVGGKRGAITRESLNSYLDLLSWSRQAGVVETSEAEALARKAARQTAEAGAALERAVGLREAIYRILTAVAAEKTPRASDLAVLNSELGRALGRLRIRPVKGPERFALQWANEDEALDQAFGPVARSAAHLLTAPDRVSRVHQCGGDNCGWLFIDSSKNHSRRWCDMRDCGNRAKVRRHRHKHPPQTGC